MIKLGNPVILEAEIIPPHSLFEVWQSMWPPSWGFWILLPLIVAAAALILFRKPSWPGPIALWILPILWIGWQGVSALHSVDATLTIAALCQLSGCVACYFVGIFLLGPQQSFRFLLIGVLAGYAFCLVRAADQKVVEFPQERQFLIESERMGWTNVPPEMLLDLKRSSVVIVTNGVEIANPVILSKYQRARVHGTLVYPNALAGVILLLFPLSATLAIRGTQRFRLPTRVAAILLTFGLGLAGLFWTGSKSGWLIALAVWTLWLLRMNWPGRMKWILVVVLVAGGMAIFAVRFQSYFASGARSVGARFDYWRAAAQTAADHPISGTGPGTFQRPYARLKAPESEMARLAHNDYLEQFSDSGIVGGLAYFTWILLMLGTLGRRLWKGVDTVGFAVFLGLLGWFMQGISEFSLYVPALAWTAFTLGGCLLGRSRV